MLEEHGGIHALGAAFQLAGIADGEFVRVSAADQKRIFGRVVLGNRCVRLVQGQFQTVRSTAFGQDAEVISLRYLLTGEELQ